MNDLGPFGFIAVALFLTVCVASCDSRLAYSECEQPLEPHLAQRAEFHAYTVLQQLFDASEWDVELRWRGP